MNKKKSLKGFTLIELIIVLAIFSVIMTLVLSFIDPVSRLITKTSVKERTSAYVDNIDEYVSKSIRYAQNINVYTHSLYNPELTKDQCTEERILRDFVDSYYDGGVSYDGTDTLKRLTGKVHILKLINTPEDGLEPGHIYETVYNFTAGRGDKREAYLYSGVLYKASDLAAMSTTDADYIRNNGNKCNDYDYHNIGDNYDSYDPKYNGWFYHSNVTLESSNVDVINPDNFKEYNYYYSLGMNTFEPISSGFDTERSKSYYYSALKRVNTSLTASEYNFPLTIVTYNDKQNLPAGVDYTINHTYTNDETLVDEDTIAFISPAAMSSLGISFKNVQMQENTRTIKFYREQIEIKYQDNDPTKDIISVVKTDDEGKVLIDPVEKNLTAKSFQLINDGYPLTVGGTDLTDNIYFVYTIPDEINDTEWKIIKETSTAPTT